MRFTNGAGNVIETHKHAGEFKEWRRFGESYNVKTESTESHRYFGPCFWSAPNLDDYSRARE
jgi:hypothetical protein